MLERRHHKGDCEIRATASGKPMIAGYAAVFGKRSLNLGGFVEDIDPSCFERTLQTADVRGLANHDPNWTLGRSRSGTLRLGTDTGGLHYEIDVNESDPDGQRALAKIERGDWDGSSFGFRAIRDSWEFGTDPAQRTLREVELYDVGPVCFPAYPDATANARAAVRLLAQQESRSVAELAAALEAGGMRSLLEQAVDLTPDEEKPDEAEAQRAQFEIEQEIERDRIWLREHGVRAAVSTVSAKVAWGPDEGFQDLLYDIEDLLNPTGWRYWAADVSLKLDKVLVWDWADGADEWSCWVAPLKVSDAGEPTVGDRGNWVAVESAYIVADTGRALRSFGARAKAFIADRERRSDGTTDQQGLLDTMNVAAQSFIAGSGGDSEQAIAMQEIVSSLNDLSENLAGTPAED